MAFLDEQPFESFNLKAFLLRFQENDSSPRNQVNKASPAKTAKVANLAELEHWRHSALARVERRLKGEVEDMPLSQEDAESYRSDIRRRFERESRKLERRATN